MEVRRRRRRNGSLGGPEVKKEAGRWSMAKVKEMQWSGGMLWRGEERGASMIEATLSETMDEGKGNASTPSRIQW